MIVASVRADGKVDEALGQQIEKTLNAQTGRTSQAVGGPRKTLFVAIEQTQAGAVLNEDARKRKIARRRRVDLGGQESGKHGVQERESALASHTFVQSLFTEGASTKEAEKESLAAEVGRAGRDGQKARKEKAPGSDFGRGAPHETAVPSDTPQAIERQKPLEFF